MSSGAFSLRRLGWISLNTLREAVRQKVPALLAALALLGLAGAQGFRDFHFGSPELKFIADLGFGLISGLGAVLAVVMPAQLFFAELERRTVLTLLAKPVGRAEFILGKFLGAAVIIATFCALFTALLAGVLWVREASLMREFPEVFPREGTVSYAQLAALGFLQGIKLQVLAALTMLIASYARTQLFTMLMGLLIFVVCHLQHFAQTAATRPGVSFVSVGMGGLARLLPNFQLFDVANTLHGSGAQFWEPIARVTGYGSAYVAIACALAVFCFQRREI